MRRVSGELWATQVDDALRSLRPIDRQVVALVYFHNYSYTDVATRLGVTYAAVAEALRRGLRAVSSAVESGGIATRATTA